MALSVSFQSTNCCTFLCHPRDCIGRNLNSTSRNSTRFGPLKCHDKFVRPIEGHGRDIRPQISRENFPNRSSTANKRSARKVRAQGINERHDALNELSDVDDHNLRLPVATPSEEDAHLGSGIELTGSTLQEIVQNLRDAPFLQCIYLTDHSLKPARQRLSEEFFEKPETWGPVREHLREAAPDGIVMVRRLDRNKPFECCLQEHSSQNVQFTSRLGDAGCGPAEEDYWGLLVHGRKVRCNSCYLLRTTKLTTLTGIATYFILIKAECFGPSIKQQFQRAFLV